MYNKIQILDDIKLQDFLKENGWKSFRIKQIQHAIYKDIALSIDDITTLSKADREFLKENTIFSSLKVKEVQNSKIDKTIKFLLETEDNKHIEMVIMRHLAGRNTLCVSSQIGCGVGCTFCATGKMGLTRNLSAFEIIEQVLIADRLLKDDDERINNVVFMGMGEPLLNYDNVQKAIEAFCYYEKLDLSVRHVTISTSGIITGIKKLLQAEYKVNLAISLHAPTEELRTKIMPINSTFTLEELIKYCKKYIGKTNRRIFFEYILIEDVNDREEDAINLSKLLKNINCHVNLIPYNPAGLKDIYKRSPQRNISKFQDILYANGISQSIRQTLGDDIDAACGQLAAKAS